MEDWRTRARRILNNVFLVLTVCGLVTYFSGEDSHVNGLVILGIGMCFKVVELGIRFLG